MLKESGYILYSTSELSEPVPIYNYSVVGEDTRVIDQIIIECMVVSARYDYTGRLAAFGDDIDLEATRKCIASDPQVREFICQKLLESNELRYIYALNGDKIYNKPQFSSFFHKL